MTSTSTLCCQTWGLQWLSLPLPKMAPSKTRTESHTKSQRRTIASLPRRLSEPDRRKRQKRHGYEVFAELNSEPIHTQRVQPDRDDEGGDHSSKGEGAGKASPIPTALLLGRAANDAACVSIGKSSSTMCLSYSAKRVTVFCATEGRMTDVADERYRFCCEFMRAAVYCELARLQRAAQVCDCDGATSGASWSSLWVALVSVWQGK